MKTKRILSLVLVLLIILALPVSAMAAEEDSIREAFETTGDYMAALGDPSAGSTGGEWMALGFARSGREAPDSYYLEGICHLYEFDCGPESGWMYQVSGKFPNYGCSSYEVQPGDRIEWLYSCIGLGADLGADVMEG